MSEIETYHCESVVKFSTVHSTLTIYPNGKKVFDSICKGKVVETPNTHKKKLLKKAEEE